MATSRLTTKNVRTRPDGKHADATERGLYLWVRNQGRSRVYLHRFMLTGVSLSLSLGPIADVDLDTARRKVRANKARLDAGESVARVKGGEVAKITFRDDVLAYHAWASGAEGSTPLGGAGHDETFEGWSAKSSKDFMRQFEHHMFNSGIGERETATLATEDLAAALLPLWKAHHNTACRVIVNIRAVLEHAIQRDTRRQRFPQRHNAADGIRRFLPKGYARKPQPMRAIPWHSMPELYARWVDHDKMPAKALRFLCLTCAPRTSEVVELKWHEINGDIWTVPAERMKGRVTRQIPLSAEAMAILDEIRPQIIEPEAYVFRGRGGWTRDQDGRKAPRRGMTGRMGIHEMRKVLRGLDLDWHVHGFRATFKSWVMDNKAHLLDPEAAELCLDHAIGNAVQEAYRDTGLLQHRRILAERWSAYLRGVPYAGPYGAQDAMTPPALSAGGLRSAA